MSFIGQFPVRLDAKNRAFMPAGFRRLLQQTGDQTLVIRKDYFENCLVVYPASQWQQEIAGVRARLNRFDGNQQMVYRKLVSEAQEVQLDSNGRMLLPKTLLEKVGIKQDILFVGMEQTIEIWAPDAAAATGEQPFMSDSEFADNLKKFMTE
ncbi:MAG: division/cell wall cluster transcriptional repressor MraZ [Bacteroidaceae bacterium]|jgi:MraZ protein|nr:division/cell wall cluster transcriptional repressor MraZ [Bacteroidaceae bacterium]